MTLNNHTIVQSINRKLSETVVQIATDPNRQANYLSEFAVYANEVLSQRDNTDVSDVRCSNCGHNLFNPNAGGDGE